jgi:hypothetical protein
LDWALVHFHITSSIRTSRRYTYMRACIYGFSNNLVVSMTKFLDT